MSTRNLSSPVRHPLASQSKRECWNISMFHRWMDRLLEGATRDPRLDTIVIISKHVKLQTLNIGVSVLHYHADNGIFASLAWREACTTSHQGFSYAGVNAHFQTGVAERRIGVLQALTRPILFHAVARWPEAINAHLWPYALRLANEANNEAPAKGNKRSPIELFTKTAVMPELKHWRPFGCPVYVLDTALQTTE